MPIKINGATSGSTTITAPATGSDETIELSTALASKLAAADQKIIQVVRATDSTARTTTSLTFVDASISVTITPQKNDSAILLIWLTPYVAYGSGSGYQGIRCAITDNSNNVISGGEGLAPWGINSLNSQGRGITIAYATPATTSATTYKGRFSSSHTTITAELNNNSTTAQLYAIEVGA